MNSLRLNPLIQNINHCQILFKNAYYLLQEASGDLSRLIDGLELDEGRLNEVEKSFGINPSNET